jgi:competence protein ComEC
MKKTILIKKGTLFALTALLLGSCLNSPPGSTIYNDSKDNSFSTTLRGNLKVHYIDVGQGDCILLQTPENNFILIDTGCQEYASKIIEFMDNLSVTTLKVFVATHPHEDHIGGCGGVFYTYDILSVYHPGYPYHTHAYKRFLNAAYQEGCPIYTDDDVDPGDFIDISSAVSCQILHINKSSLHPNDASIVLRVDYNNVSFLFTGDISGYRAYKYSNVESPLVDNWDVDVDILKVAHHGSRYSSSDYFLDEATPAISVISCSEDNPYNHPHPDTLSRLTAHNSSIYRTDLNGTVTIVTNGDTWDIMYEKPNHPPSQPTITGPASGKIGKEYTYRFNTTEPNGDHVFYYIEWGDGAVEEWIGPYAYHVKITINHTYSEKGIYIIKAKAKDSTGLESEWGEFEVNISKSKLTNPTWLKLLKEPLERFPALKEMVLLFLKFEGMMNKSRAS